MQVLAITFTDGERLVFSHESDLLTIRLPDPGGAGTLPQRTAHRAGPLRWSAGGPMRRALPHGTGVVTPRMGRILSVGVLLVGLTSRSMATPAPMRASSLPQRQVGPDSAFVDSVARQLHAAAVANWKKVDESLRSYTARIEQRMAAAVRTPLKDRVVYRSESAMRVLWQRDAGPVTQVLGTRSSYPGRDSGARARNFRWLSEIPFEKPFDPSGDRLLFGLAKEAPDSGEAVVRARTEIRNLGIVGAADDFWFAHPLTENAGADYRFRSGDTLTLSFPDGSRLKAVQLDILPREADPHLISGTLWIEPGSGALVRAVYRLARPLDMIRDMELEPGESGPPPFPPMLRPLTMDVAFVSVTYGLWEDAVWMPRAMRMEAEIGVGALVRFPVSFEMSYRIESVVVGQSEAADASAAFIAQSLERDDGVSYEVVDRTVWGEGPGGMVIVPTDPEVAANSPHLPPPIWNEAVGFQTGADRERFVAALAALPEATSSTAIGRLTLDWPWTREGLLRYNRVEGLAVGTRLKAALGRRLSLAATGGLGLADLRPKARVALERSTGLRRLSLASFHELRATDAAGRYLGLGNSARALFLGRDYGDYYQSTGAELTWRPPALAPESFSFRVYGERQTTVETEAAFAVFRAFSDDWSFRPNPIVDDIEEAGAELLLSPWWGGEPSGAQFGLDLHVQGATWRPFLKGLSEGRESSTDDTGDDYVRASAIVRTVVPLFSGTGALWRLGAEAGAGTGWGEVPAQRAWPLGGAATLRGFRPGTVSGTTFLRGRLELARATDELGASFFGDAGWAGDRTAFGTGDVLYGVGLGVTILDGLLRVDLARALNGSDPKLRVHVHVDAIM